MRFQFAGVLLVCCILGCDGCTQVENFEGLGATDSLPEGWQLKTHAGKLTALCTSESKSGTRAVSLGGLGRGDLIGRQFTVPPKRYVSLALWMKPKFDPALPGNKRLLPNSASVGYLDSESDTVLYSMQVDISQSSWKKIDRCVYYNDAESPSVVRPFVRLEGNGTLVVDDVVLVTSATPVEDQEIRVVEEFEQRPDRIDVELQLKHGGFEGLAFNSSTASKASALSEWEFFCDPSGGTAKRYSTKPAQGRSCLRLLNFKGWCAVVWKERVPSDAQVFVQGSCRTVSGSGRVRFEYYQGNQQLGQTSEVLISSRGWQNFTCVSDIQKAAQADHISVVLAGEASGARPVAVDFDDLSIVVVKQ